ncbi:fused MFS/spermidine synthase [Neisseria gonorrhoeae]
MNSTASKTLKGLSLVFFASGFCALIYQVSWQRLLFSHIGIDLSSITVIISVFMVGLGVGAYFGGRIADRFPSSIIPLFCIAEVSIGLFGLGHLLVEADLPIIAAANFLLLLLPTFMMGATLPLLTCFFNRKIHNVGESIGTLYFFNTLGAALGSLAAAEFFYVFFTLSQTIALTACLNLLIAASVWLRYRKDGYGEH